MNDPSALLRRWRRAPARHLVRGVGLALVLTLVVPSLSAVSGAQEAIVVDDPRLHPSLAGVEVSGSGRQSVVAAVRGAEGRVGAARAALSEIDAALAAAAERRTELEQRLEAARAEHAAATERAAALRARLRELAVHSYTRGSSTPPRGIDLERVNTEMRQQALVNTVSSGQQSDLRATTGVVERSGEVIDESTSALEALGPEITGLEARRVEQASALDAATADLSRSRQALADWRIGADVAGSDIPLVVLDAYVKAAERLAAERPACGLKWWGLAGIGKVETRHATYLGTRPGPDGVTLRQIIGIPLDGNNATAVIPDSDAGLLDGDPVWDRAVGPMQFIPGTWRTQGRDGDADGRADPHNVYDAALSAAGLLCGAAGAGLDQGPVLRQAALAYNASGAYADLVVRHALDYAARADELIPPLPDLRWLSEPPVEAAASPAVPSDEPGAAGPPTVVTPAAPPSP